MSATNFYIDVPRNAHKIDKNVISKIRLVGIVKQSCGSLSNPLDVIARDKKQTVWKKIAHEYAYWKPKFMPIP